MFKQIVLSFLLLQIINTQCGKGCLRCKSKSETDTTKECQLCDMPGMYYLKSDGVCTKSDQSNCRYLNHDNVCVSCEGGYYISGGKCVAVDVANKVDNCQYYDSSQKCSGCQTDYLLETSKCVVVTSKISNCMTYRSQTECSSCNWNYYISEDSKSCSQLPTSNCVGFTDALCTECTGNTIMDKNYPLESMYKFTNNTQRNGLFSMLSNQKNSYRTIMHLNACKSVTALNCGTLKSFDECDTCVSKGYYKNQDSKKCIVIPEPIIPNCSMYSYLTANKWRYKCMKCASGYYIETGQKSCKKAETPANCISWDTTVINAQTCLECQADKVLKSNTCTTDRVNKNIENCQVYDKQNDKCSACKTNYQLNSTGLVCKPSIANCMTHNATFDASTTTLECTTCNNEYWLNSTKTCTKGTLNCDIYSTETNCTLCKNKFFDDAGECDKEHATIANCDIYSQTSTHRCGLCTEKFFSGIVKKQCLSYTPISKCTTHATSVASDVVTVTCTLCNSGYKPAADSKTCTSIGSNCLTIDGSSNCTSCESGYYLATDYLNSNAKSCQSIQEHVKTNCTTPNHTGATVYGVDNSCQVCDIGYYGKDEKQCVAKSNLKYLDADAPSDTTVYDNCLELLYTDMKCQRCKASHILSSANVCETTCAGVIKLETANGGSKCDTALTATNQVKTAYAHVINSVKIALACKSDTYTLWNSAGATSNQNKFYTVGGSEPKYLTPGDVSQDVICKDLTAVKVAKNNTAAQATTTASEFWGALINEADRMGSNRELWQQTVLQGGTDHLYLRIGCGWGKKSTIKIGTNTNIRYLDCSTYSSTPFSSNRYGGVPAKWSNIFNVHECSSSNKLATIVAETDGDTNSDFVRFQPYNFDQDVVQLTVETGSKDAFLCLDNSSKTNLKTDLGISVVDGNVDLMANCGLALLDLKVYINRTAFKNTYYAGTDAITGNSSLKCLACKPGYHSTTTLQNLQRQCIAIPNCSTTSGSQKIFGGCSQCAPEYALEVTSAGVVDFNSCVKTQAILTNCFAFEKAGGHTDTNMNGKCKYCNKGYALNRDGRCEQMQQPKCQNNKFQPTYVTVTHSGNSTEIYDYFKSDAQGCIECDSQYILLTTKVNQCFKSPQLTDSSDKKFSDVKIIEDDKDSRDETNFINKCSKYLTTGLCYVCMTNHILTVDKKHCLTKDNTGSQKLSNCQIADNGKLNCNTCDVGYSLVSNACSKGNISNCSTYQRTTTKSVITCTQCDTGHWLNNGTKCDVGKIKNCDTYADSVENCQSCNTGYWNYVGTSGNKTKYCIPVETSMNCASVTMSEQTETINGMAREYLELTCATCNANAVLKTTNDNTPKCLNLWHDPKCEKISKTQDLGSTSYSYICTLCANDYYIDTSMKSQTCKQRSGTYPNCKTNVKDADKCEACNTNHYLSSDEKSCTAYPTGDYACTEYDNSLVCQECDDDHYLSERKCIKVTNSVDNCKLYSADKKCKSCDSNYFLTSEILCEQQSSGLNCLEWASKDSCKSCFTQYKLEDNTNSTKKCTLVAMPSKCSMVDVSNGKCTQCVKDYYVSTETANAGTCLLKDPAISNCDVMMSKDQCKTCQVGFAQSNDKKSCLAGRGLAGVCRGEMTTSPVCTACAAGYSFQNGATSCSANPNFSVSNGCFAEILADKSCNFCISGWSMGTDGKCTDNNPPTPPTDKSGSILKVMMILIALLFQVI